MTTLSRYPASAPKIHAASHHLADRFCELLMEAYGAKQRIGNDVITLRMIVLQKIEQCLFGEHGALAAFRETRPASVATPEPPTKPPIDKVPASAREIKILRWQYERYKLLDDVCDEDVYFFITIYQRLRNAGAEFPPHEVFAVELFIRQFRNDADGHTADREQEPDSEIHSI